jgi:drug/metabolite transporter (DMT)-like permease
MLAGFFVVVGLMGAAGLAILTLWPLAVPEGPAAFLLRGPEVPTDRFLFWTFVQAAGSLVAVGMMIRAYQITDASRVAVFEYVILPASACWGWYLWGERLGPMAWGGMALIVAAGSMIAFRARAQEG